MAYMIKPCEDCDIEFIWEKGFEAVTAEENAKQELLVFKVVDVQGAIIGGCVLDIDEMKTAEIDRLWVDARYRNLGIGSALIRRAEQEAREKGCRSIVNTYIFDFQTAKRLFERHGYRHIGTVRDWPKGYESYTLIKKLDCGLSTVPLIQDCFEIKTGSEEDGKIIADRLEEYNRSFAPRSHAYLDIDRKIVDDNGTMIAGCIAGISGWDTLHIDVFWVDDAYCGSNNGSFLLGEIEHEAKEKGAYLSNVGGMDLQAAFFKKHGYEVSAVFEDQPKWYVLHKHL